MARERVTAKWYKPLLPALGVHEDTQTPAAAMTRELLMELWAMIELAHLDFCARSERFR